MRRLWGALGCWKSGGDSQVDYKDWVGETVQTTAEHDRDCGNPKKGEVISIEEREGKNPIATVRQKEYGQFYVDVTWLELASKKEPRKEPRELSVGGIGSRKGTTKYDFNNDIVYCGCFQGTLAKFEVQVKRRHGFDKTPEGQRYYKEYMGLIDYIKKIS